MIELQAAGGPPEALAGLARVLVHCIGELLQHPVTHSASRAQALFDSVCVYLQNHYQYDITLDSVARQFEINPNHLSRLFKSQGQVSFSGYLTHVRIARAKF